MSIRQDYEVADVGGGLGGIGQGGGLMWVLVLILIFLFFFGRNGERDGHNDGARGCISTCAIDRDVILQNKDAEKVTVYEAEKTRGLIVREAELEAGRQFQKGLMENAELKAKINTLEIEKNIDNKFGMMMGKMQNDFWRLDCELGKVAKTQPAYAFTVSPLTSQVPGLNPCEFPRRCGE